MHYDIKISGVKEGKGMLEVDRVGFIAYCTKDIATKALMLRLGGYSALRPTKDIRSALAVRLHSFSGNAKDAATMVLDCDPFERTIRKLQYDFFRPVESVLKETPMSLVIQSFRAAITQDDNGDQLDKPLLKSLLAFQKGFAGEEEVFTISNRKSIPSIEIRCSDFKRIAEFGEQIPNPHAVAVNGQLDEMKFSKSKIVLLTDGGAVNVFATSRTIMEGILQYMGKEVTVVGMGHYRPSGQLSYLEIHSFHEPGARDRTFGRKPVQMDVKQQVLFQLKSGKKPNAIFDLVGKWPGEESDEEMEQALKELDE